MSHAKIITALFQSFRGLTLLAASILALAGLPGIAAAEGASAPNEVRLGGSLASTWEFGMYSLPYWFTPSVDLHVRSGAWQGGAALRLMAPSLFIPVSDWPPVLLCLEFLPLGFQVNPWEPRIGRGLQLAWEPRLGGGLMLNLTPGADSEAFGNLAVQTIIAPCRFVLIPAEEDAATWDLSILAFSVRWAIIPATSLIDIPGSFWLHFDLFRLGLSWKLRQAH